MKSVCVGLVTLLALGLAAGPSTATRSPSSQVAGIERKLNHIAANGQLTHPDQTPTVLTEAEVNAYLASEQVTLPQGLQSVTLQGNQGAVAGLARVDFDRAREGIHSSNPLLAIFTGIHDVEVVTHSYGADHKGYVHVDSVSLDGVEVPRFALELFIEKYLQPKAPQIGMDSVFALPDKIDIAVVGQHKLTLTQK